MLNTTIGGVYYKNCLFNAAGPKCSTKEELDDLSKVDEYHLGGFVSKSMTLKERKGNKGLRYVDTDWGSINSMGLPNKGYEFYLDYYEKRFVNGCSDCRMFLSVSGMTVEDSLSILCSISEMGKRLGCIVMVELNLSCPNIAGKSQLGYDFEAVKVLLWKIRKLFLCNIILGVKLPPYFDMVHFKNMADILLCNKDLVRFIVCINSIGNGLVIDFDKESVVIEPKEGFGGIGGDYVLPTALANVRKFYQLLNGEIDIIGVGGVKSGKEAFMHILCGASAVQIGTALMKEGCDVFGRVSKELNEIMSDKGYKNLEDFRGKLKLCKP